MFENTRSGILAVVLLVAIAAPVTVPAQSSDTGMATAGPAKNVLLTVRLGRLDGGKRVDVKSYRLVLVSGGPGSRFLSGARLPFPTTTEDVDSDDDVDATNFVYQNIGFTTEVHAWVMDDGKIKLMATLEDSFVDEQEGRELPRVETRQLSVNALLEPGKPLEVGRVEGIRDSSGFVELEAEVLP